MKLPDLSIAHEVAILLELAAGHPRTFLRRVPALSAFAPLASRRGMSRVDLQRLLEDEFAEELAAILRGWALRRLIERPDVAPWISRELARGVRLGVPEPSELAKRRDALCERGGLASSAVVSVVSPRRVPDPEVAELIAVSLALRPRDSARLYGTLERIGRGELERAEAELAEVLRNHPRCEAASSALEQLGLIHGLRGDHRGAALAHLAAHEELPERATPLLQALAHAIAASDVELARAACLRLEWLVPDGASGIDADALRSLERIPRPDAKLCAWIDRFVVRTGSDTAVAAVVRALRRAAGQGDLRDGWGGGVTPPAP